MEVNNTFKRMYTYAECMSIYTKINRELYNVVEHISNIRKEDIEKSEYIDDELFNNFVSKMMNHIPDINQIISSIQNENEVSNFIK